MTASRHHDVVIVGGGNAGVSLAARLLRDGASDVALFSDRSVHAYRPLLNYVGGGQARIRAVERSMRQVLPDGCAFIHDAVVGADPENSLVHAASGLTASYSHLVIASGLREAWDQTDGLEEAYAINWAVSTFVTASAPLVWPRVRELRRGTAVFTVPPEPASCAPTALKPLFLACDHWRRRGILSDIDVHLVLPSETVIGMDAADAVIASYLDRYGVRVHRGSVVRSVAPLAGRVILSRGDGDDLVDEVIDDVSLAHVVPHYAPAPWIAESGLAMEGSPGLVDVDPETLRHRAHPSVCALGDAAALQTRPSGGALRRQVSVLSASLTGRATGAADATYDGYTVTPVTVARRRAILPEFDRTGRPAPSIPLVDLLRPRWSTWFVDRHILPIIYFHRILRGRV